MKIDISSIPPSCGEIENQRLKLEQTMLLALHKNRVVGVICSFVVLVCAAWLYQWLFMPIEGINKLTKLLVLFFLLGFMGLAFSLAVSGRYYGLAASVGPVIYGFFSLYISSEGYGWLKVIDCLLGSLFCVLVGGAFFRYIYSFSKIDGYTSAEEEIYELGECNHSYVIDVDKWLVCPEVRTYVSQVASQQRKILICEYLALSHYFSEWKKRTELDAANKNVYGVSNITEA